VSVRCQCEEERTRSASYHLHRTFLRSSGARATRQNPLATPGKSRCLPKLPGRRHPLA